MQNKDGSIENPFDEETKKPRQKKKTLVFAVAEPRNEKDYPVILDILEKRENTLLLHNRYNYGNDKGRAVLAQLKSKKEPPFPGHVFERIMRQDFWGIEQADVVVFDLDSIESFHLMAVAAVYGKPIVCVSETLRPLPAYFTGSVVGVFKLSEIDMVLKLAKGRKKKRRKPKEDDAVKINDVEGNNKKVTTTKEQIQGMLQKSFQQHAENIRDELR